MFAVISQNIPSLDKSQSENCGKFDNIFYCNISSVNNSSFTKPFKIL